MDVLFRQHFTLVALFVIAAAVHCTSAGLHETVRRSAASGLAVALDETEAAAAVGAEDGKKDAESEDGARVAAAVRAANEDEEEEETETEEEEGKLSKPILEQCEQSESPWN